MHAVEDEYEDEDEADDAEDDHAEELPLAHPVPFVWG